MKILRSDAFIIFIGTFIVCYIAFLNHFPLVYDDTGTYVSSGFEHYLPNDRPVFYGIFIRHISLATSLWFVVLAQGLLISYTVFRTFDMFYSGNKRNFLFITSIIFLTVFTGISHNVSIILPDIFSPIGILCLLTLLLNNKISKWQRGVLIVILTYCMLVHFSNFLIFSSLTFLLLAYNIVRRIKKKPVAFKRNRLIGIYASLLSVLVITPVVNYSYSKQFVYSKGSHVFMIAHLLETGILDDYLRNECAHKNYKLCNYVGNYGGNFMWDWNTSPLYKMGGWDSTRKEYNAIILDIVTTPKYAKELILQGFEYSFIEMFSFDIPKNGVYLGDSPPLSVINKYFPKYFGVYTSSLQNIGALDFTLTDEFQRILVFASLALLLCVIVSASLFNILPTELKWLTVLILVFGYLNAAICANFSTIHNRFQNRIAWLVPMVAIMVAEHLISNYLQKKKSNPS
jgi:hypothetical protein